MDISKIGEIISTYTPLVVIVDEKGLISWMSTDFKNQSNINSLLAKLEELFKTKYTSAIKHNGIIIEDNGHKYKIIAHEIFAKNKDYTIFIFNNLNKLDNKDIKIFALESIIANINDGIVASDFDGKVVIYNKAMENLEDKKAGDMLGQYLWNAYGYGNEEGSEHRNVFYTGEALINKYSAHAYSKGLPKYVSYSTYPLIKDGEKIGVYTISKNETKLQALLSETINLKRQFNNNQEEKSYKSNGTTFSFDEIIGTSDSINKLIKEAQAISWLDNNILIVGETGTGKEVFAQSIHNYGKRNNEPFIGINCSAIPENLLESILFGTVKGAFTGALDHTGLFEEAKGGTLFLDELNSMPITMQTKLLRVLQERMVRPVGGNTTYPINCRIISAMNEEPQDLIKNDRLREDLYYRIAGFNLFLPPLRERTVDIFDLSDSFINNHNKSMGKNVVGISKELKNLMGNYSWPGNVRELQHFIENLMVRVDEDEEYLRINHIPEYIGDKIMSSQALDLIIEEKESLPNTLNSVERKIILEALDKNKWNISKTSRELGIIRQSLLYRIKKLNIERK